MTNRAIDSAVVARIFKRLRLIYGSQKFLTALEAANVETDTALWIEQLTRRRFTLDRIAKALEVCIDYHPVFVPGVGEFLALCETCAALMPVPSLPALTHEPRSNPEFAAKAMEAIKTFSAPRSTDWAIAVLNRSLRESQIVHSSQRVALDALRHHGRLGDVPEAWKIKNKAPWDNYDRRAA